MRDDISRITGVMPEPYPAPGEPTHRAIWEIATEIRRLWVKKDGSPNVWFGAVPYLEAMGSISHISESYGCDSAKSVVLYFLANAAQFRGPDARRIKLELKAICGV